MKGTDIRKHANLHVGMSIQAPYVQLYINEALSVLASEYPETVMRVEDITYPVDDDKRWHTFEEIENYSPDPPDPYTIPVIKRDMQAIRSVTDSDGHAVKEFEVRNNKVKFPSTGTYSIEVFKMPEQIETINDHPDVSPPYHMAIAAFVASREKSRLFGDEDADSLRLYQEFMRQSEKAHLLLKRQKRGPRVMQAPSWV